MRTMDDVRLRGDSYHVYLWGERVTQGEFDTVGPVDQATRQNAARAVIDAVAQVVTAQPDRLDPPVPQPRALDESERAAVDEALAELVALTSTDARQPGGTMGRFVEILNRFLDPG